MSRLFYCDAFWISPYAFSVYVALREKELPFELVEVKLHVGDQHAPGYRNRSLTGKVPALEEDDFFLAESSAIVEYLDESGPGRKMLPQGVKERARARQIMSFIRSDLMALREERSTATMFYEKATAPLSPAGQLAADRLVRVAEGVVPNGKSFLFGDFSIADADLAFMLHRLILNGEPVPAKARAFADAIWQRPAVQEWVTHVRPPYVPY